ncbi:hypothetical protein C5167_015212 [Papaver somniferum]|uniref:Uncharacterized protein n=1 Tax=Papaver somniferum TaxID=3469 RepID=A0A4Y7J8I4_PAPSO|nr:hypothetical protein C5167_015212 [Papaver somniferum]
MHSSFVQIDGWTRIDISDGEKSFKFSISGKGKSRSVANVLAKLETVWGPIISYAILWEIWSERNARAFGGRAKEENEM